MRSEFEKIEWVKERLNHVWWSQERGYCDTGKHPRANASFLNGALHLFKQQQTKVYDLQKQLIDQGQRFNEQAQRVKDLEHKNSELQKRVDAALKITGDNLRYVSQNHRDIFKPLLMTMIRSFKELEQALKGGEL